VTCAQAADLSGDDSSRSAGSPASEETRSFSVDEAHLSFDLPSDWEEFDRDTMQEALSDSTVMDDLTDRMGMSSEQFQQMMASNIDLLSPRHTPWPVPSTTSMSSSPTGSCPA
jgi:hypothetical protein